MPHYTGGEAFIEITKIEEKNRLKKSVKVLLSG